MQMQTLDPTASRLRCVLIPRFNLMTLTGLLEPVRVANYLSNTPLYDVELHSFDGAQITSSSGVTVDCTPPPERLDRNDTVFLFGSWGAEHYQNPRLISWLRLQARLGVQLCAVEIGAYVMARAGLLSGKSATTHWSYLPGFQEQFPDVKAVEQLYTQDGNVLTCAGGTAGIDLMFHLIEGTHGNRLVGEVSDQIMHHPVRADVAPQRVTLGRGKETLPLAVRSAVDLMQSNISEPLTVPEIADSVGLSQRQLERQFSKEMGCSVVQFGLLMRLQHARVLLISTAMGVREISTASGFNSLSHFAYAFKKCFGKRPSDYRQAWPEQEDEPHWPGTLSRFLDTIEVRRRASGQSSGGIP